MVSEGCEAGIVKKLILIVLLALGLACQDKTEFGSFEMWIFITNPSRETIWSHSDVNNRLISWSSVPGDSVRCYICNSKQKVKLLFDWIDKSHYEIDFTDDISCMAPGVDYQLLLEDDQGFFALSERFSIVASR